MEPAIVEAVACSEALSLAQDLHLQSIHVSSDCLGVVKDIQTNNLLCSYGPTVGEIAAKSSRFACLASGIVDENVSSPVHLPESSGSTAVVRSVLAAGYDAEAASAVYEAELDGRRKVLSDAELHDAFWSFVGFPTPGSRFWERSDSEPEADSASRLPRPLRPAHCHHRHRYARGMCAVEEARCSSVLGVRRCAGILAASGSVHGGGRFRDAPLRRWSSAIFFRPWSGRRPVRRGPPRLWNGLVPLRRLRDAGPSWVRRQWQATGSTLQFWKLLQFLTGKSITALALPIF